MLFFALVCVGAFSPLRAESDSPRERILFTTGWRFQKDDPAGTGDALDYRKMRAAVLASASGFVAWKDAPFPLPATGVKTVSYAEPAYDDSGWRKLNLPHDWGIEGPFDQNLPGETGKLPFFGVGWYRKTFDATTADKAKRVFLQIDGAMSRSAVWLNGKFVGGWPYGYSSFQLDLTPYLQIGKNVIAIRLDNPKESSRWYPGSGLYRNVWLVKTAPVHLLNWGTHVTTPQIGAGSATVNIAMRVANPCNEAVVLAAAIYELDAAGRRGADPVAGIRLPATQKPGADGTYRAQLQIKTPKLWNLDKPNLYVALTGILVGDKIIDQVETTFGLRTLEFTSDKGFLLNGKRVPIQGVCLHHDLGALGSAFNTRAMQREIEILKEMGVNAIRCAHNPPAPELLDLCDRMGILVMDEFVDVWKRGKVNNGYQNLFDDWSENDVRAMVRRDRNHPSVFLWSLGNEILEQSAGEGPSMQKRLYDFVHAEDPTRSITMAVSDGGAGYNGFQKGLDVFGYNYKPWEYKKFHDKNPSIPLFGSETSSTLSSRGEYSFPVVTNRDGGKSDFQVSSYDLYYESWATSPEAEFKGQDENPSVMGEFVWTGFDYLGEPTPYNNDVTNLLNYHTPEDKAAAEKQLKELGKIRVPSRSSYFGIVDLAGFKKDRFYLYQARWRPDLPMAHILPHWNWPERLGEITPVHVYTSGDEAELFLNGQSLGRKKKAPLEYRLVWNDVKYQPGELKVVAYKNGRKWAEDTVKTTGPAAQLLLRPDRALIRADGRDLSYVTVTVADQAGLLVPRSKPLIKFEISGPAEIIATDNGDPTDQTVFGLPERKAFNGLALVIVRGLPGKTGDIKLTARSEGLPPATTTLVSR